MSSLTRRLAVIGVAVVLVATSGVVLAVRDGVRLSVPLPAHSAPAAVTSGPTRVMDRTGSVLLAEPGAPKPPAVKAPQFVAYVERELTELGFEPGRQPLVVQTTLDYGHQQLAEQVVRDGVAANRFRDAAGQLSSSLVSMQPATGQIVAMVGSPDFNAPGGQVDYASVRPINVGNSIIPFVYARALADRRIDMATTVVDGPNPFPVPAGASVYNYDRRSHGTLPVGLAAATELNIPAVKIELAVGVPALVDSLRRLGMAPRLPGGPVSAPDTAFGPSLALGGYPVTLLEEVSAFSTLADLGEFHQPEAILRVTDGHGKVLYEADRTRGARQALDPGAAYILDQMLSDDANRQRLYGKGSLLHLTDRRSMAIAGTAESFKTGMAAGFTPDLATAVWTGDVLGADYTMQAGADGVYVAAPAWHAYMEQALAGMPADHWYAMPPDVVQQGGAYFLTGARGPAALP